MRVSGLHFAQPNRLDGRVAEEFSATRPFDQPRWPGSRWSELYPAEPPLMAPATIGVTVSDEAVKVRRFRAS
jgi:hypothetical protein